MSVTDLNATRIFTLARLNTSVTTPLEIAGVGEIDGVGNLSGNRIEWLVYVRVDHRLALLQAYSIRMERIVEYIVCRSLLYHASCIHNYDLVCHLGYYSEIVGDQHY